MNTKNTFSKNIAKFLVFMMIVQLMPLHQIGRNYNWSIKPYKEFLYQISRAIAPPSAQASELNIFGPKQFIREKGKSSIYTENISSTECFATLLVTNGEEDGSNRINSAAIFLNDLPVLKSSQINNEVYTLKLPIMLSGDDTLEIELNSAPDSYLTLEIIEPKVPYYGPKKFIRTTGAPNEYEEQINLPSGEATLIVLNGESGGDNRVSSGVAILLNNTEIFEPEDLNQTVFLISKNVDLTGEDTLQVKLRSTPESYVRIYIVAAPPEPTANLTIEPAIIKLGESTQLTWESAHADDCTITPDIGAVLPNGTTTVSPIKTTTYTFTAGSYWGTTDAQATVTVLINRPPNITSTSVTGTVENQPYTYDVDAVDPNSGDILTFSLTTSPVGMTINAATGLIQWTPDYDAAGNHDVVVRVQDQEGASDTQNFTIVVDDVNRPPVINPIDDQTMNEGEPLTLNISATDPDGNTLAFTVNNLPDFADFNNSSDGSATIVLQPDFSDSGQYTISVVVSDGELSALHSFSLSILNSNRAPKITSTAIITGTENIEYVYDVDATDPDGDTLTYSLLTGPDGLTIDSSTGVISWIPGSEQTGSHTITVEVSDENGGTDTQTFTVNVMDVNHPPEITSTAVVSISQQASINGTSGNMLYESNPYPGASDSNIFIFCEKSSIPYVSTQPLDYGDIHQGTLVDSYYVQYDPASKTGTVGSGSVVFNQPILGVMTSTNNFTANLNPDVNSTSDRYFGIEDTHGPYPTDAYPEFRGLGSPDDDLEFTIGDNTFTVLSLEVPLDNALDAIRIFTAANTGNVDYTYDVKAVDEDGDVLTYSLATAPTGMTIDSVTGLITWEPGEDQFGDHQVSVTVSDGNGGTDTQTYTITVQEPVNNPPKLDPIDAITINESDTVDIQISATDPNGDSLTLSVTDLPAFAQFTDNGNGTGVISMPPDYTHAGLYSFTVSVSDGDLTDSQQVSLTVVDVNRPPVADAGGPYQGEINAVIIFDGGNSQDPDGDSLTYSWNFGDGSPDVTGSQVDHAYNQEGSFTASLTVDDGSGGSDTKTDLVTVTPLAEIDLEPVSLDVTAVNIDPQTLEVSGSVELTVINNGNKDVSGDYQIVLFEDTNTNQTYDNGTDRLLGTTTLYSLPQAGKTTAVSIDISGAASFAGNLIYAFVDSENIVSEVNEDNNINRVLSASMRELSFKNK